MSTDKELKPRQRVEVSVQINDRQDRDAMITALANAGYSVRVDIQNRRQRLGSDYWVVFDVPDESEQGIRSVNDD